MQSPVAIVLRASVLLACLGFLPLMAAGGLSAPEKLYSQAQTWLASHAGDELELSPRTIQVELPAEALRYRAVGSPIELDWDDSAESEAAEVMPASYEEILPPASHDAIPANPAQPWKAESEVSLPGRMTTDEQVFETGKKDEPLTNATLADVEDQLRKLGAADVQLQPWGSTSQFYRYSAVIPVAGSAEVQRVFQSIGPNPDQVAQEVLAQVTASMSE